VGRTRCGGVSSRTVDEEDQKSMSSLMRSSGRSRPRARRTSIRQLPESRSRPIGPRIRLWPTCTSPSGAVYCRASRGRPGRVTCLTGQYQPGCGAFNLISKMFHIDDSVIDNLDGRCNYCEGGVQAVAVELPGSDRPSCPGRYPRFRTPGGWLIAVDQGRSVLAALDSDVIPRRLPLPLDVFPVHLP